MVELSDTRGEDWNEMASLYKQLTSEVAVRPINELLERVNALLPFRSATAIHDNGCGPGPVLARILSVHGAEIPADTVLSCSDFSAAMIAQVQATKAAAVAADPASPWARVDAQIRDAMDLAGIPDASRSHVTAGWVYFMTPDPRRCLKESLRVLGEGGVLGCSSWKNSDWMDLMGVVKEVRPEVKTPEIPAAWSSVAGLRGELTAEKFRDVDAVEVPVTMSFESYDALLDLLLCKMPHMIMILKDFSDEEKARARELAAEKLAKMAPTKPYRLDGTALVAVGRK